MNPENYSVSTNKSKLNVNLIHEFLTNSYWAKGISRNLVEKRIKNSLCFGLYEDDKQIGFARVITDFTAFAYLLDVFIIENERDKGLSRILLDFIFSYPELKGMKKWMLATNDAHGLYTKYGFHPLKDARKIMEKD